MAKKKQRRPNESSEKKSIKKSSWGQGAYKKQTGREENNEDLKWHLEH
ncbi:MAG: hypothetical protein Q8P79_01130 [Nanoarchaeota archaeon]|nr:hypothetical protein [Nanoarchaeota archaeon]